MYTSFSALGAKGTSTPQHCLSDLKLTADEFPQDAFRTTLKSLLINN
jgi:hypothetical protein